MILGRIANGIKRQDWSVVIIETMVLVAGVFIGLQADAWNTARLERAEEQDYLVRLLDDTDRNIETLRVSEDRFVELIQSLERSVELFDGAQPQPGDDRSVQFALCRWYIEPAVGIQRGTYTELVSSGKLGLLQDTGLRDQLESTDTRHAQVAQQHVNFGNKLVSLSDRLEPARTWHMVDNYRETRCDIDWDVLRSIPQARSALAQLFFTQSFYRRDRNSQLNDEKKLQAALLCNLEPESCR